MMGRRFGYLLEGRLMQLSRRKGARPAADLFEEWWEGSLEAH